MQHESLEVKLAREIYALEQKAESLSASAKDIATQLSGKMTELQSYLVNEGKTSTGHIDGVGIFSLRRSNHCSVRSDRMPQFFSYLRKHNLSSLIVEYVHPQTIKKVCGDKVEEYIELFVEDGDEATKYQQSLVAKAMAACADEYTKACAAEELETVPAELERLQALRLRELSLHEVLPPAELAKKVLESVGVSVYQEIKLQHKERGK